ncbi:TIR domain-containing protein [Streptomyces sp. NPDC053560]|uniref:WD40 domain-containing protein n=1 Tax=Streptomyces sp. NPDC053560 TaxID=3365711 RepID=UPI0037D586FF
MLSEGGTQTGPGDRPLFFVSYSPADEAWATWIAWTLEREGYRTVIQAWDFTAGTNFIDYMDRGVSESAAVIAVLSQNYARSRYGRMEWQAALRASPDNPEQRLITVRIDEAPIDGLLATITYIDLVAARGEAEAREMLLARARDALNGRAQSSGRPGFPGTAASSPPVPPQRTAATRNGDPWFPGRLRPRTAPAFPLNAPEREGDHISVLHLPGPDFGRGNEPDDTLHELRGDLLELQDADAPRPDLVVVTGNLTASGTPRECGQALSFLTSLRAQLDLRPHQIVLVPGAEDVSLKACSSYFSSCEADEVTPQQPYWEKWRHYAKLFHEFYEGIDRVFAADQPWTLFPVPELNTVVAGFNSTMAYSHRPEDQFGYVGRDQITWFAEALHQYERDGWLRIGAIRHPLETPAATGGPGVGAIRDAEAFQRLAAPRLNLLLHGPVNDPRTTRRDPVDTRLGTLPVFGAAAPARFQLLKVSASGVTRWHSPTAPAAEFREEWRRVRTPLGPQAFPSQAPRQEPDPVRDTFTDQVKEICRAKWQDVGIRDVTVRRSDDPTTQFVATWKRDGLVFQSRIAALPGDPREEDLARFAEQVRAAEGTTAENVLVYGGQAPPRDVVERFGDRIRVRSFLEFQGLIDLRAYVADQTARLSSDRAYRPELYLPQRYREVTPGSGGGGHGRLVDELLDTLDTEHGRFVLLLGDFGHGKTFSLRELARRLPEQSPHLTPVFIPLNTFDRAHSLMGLVTTHLANHGVSRIDTNALQYMIRQGRIVLLFDGFDELVNRVSYDRAADHLQALLDAAVDHTKIVVTSRTQHFKSTEQVFTALGERVGALPQRRVLTVESFQPQQIKEYLERTYDSREKAEQRYDLLAGIPNLLELCGNPRLLSFVTALSHEQLQSVAGAGRTLSAAGLYEEVLTAWLEFEVERGSGGPGAAPGLSLEDLWKAVSSLAVRLWETRRSVLRLDELAETTGRALDGLTRSHMTAEERAQAVGAGSLLVRTEDNLFQFIHTSVVEWLIAREAARQLAGPEEGTPPLLAARPLTQLAVEFFCDLADRGDCQEWVRRVLGDVTAPDSPARQNAVRVNHRLRIPTDVALRGVVLRGENLSHRDFSGVDFTGADLGETVLTGAKLAGADLTGVNLSAANLDDADLSGACLEGADLSRARLIRADLRGARLSGSRWSRAALVSTRMDPEQPAAPELRSAAIAPGMPVDVGLRPAAVGVPYGFDLHHVRLPEPMAYARDGELLAVGTEDGGVLICDPDDGRPLRTLRGHHGRVYAVKFAHDLLVTGGADGHVVTWDPATGREQHRFEVHPDGVWPVVVEPSGKLLVTGDKEGLVTVWDPADGRPVHHLAGHAAPVYTAGFSPDGTLLLTGDASSRVRMWDLATGQCVREIDGHRGSVYRAAFAPDGRRFVTADNGDGEGGHVRVWETETGRLLHDFAGHPERVYTLSFHPGGKWLASGDTSGQVRLWDVSVGASLGCLETLGGGVYQVRFEPAGNHLAACGSNGSVRLWTVAGTSTPDLRQHPKQPEAHRGSAWCVAFRSARAGDASQGRSQLVTVGNDGGAHIWEIAAGRGKRLVNGHNRRVVAVSFSPDGERISVGGNDGAVRVWAARTGKCLSTLQGRGDRLVSALFSPAPEGQVAAASNDGDVYLFSSSDGEYQRQFDANTEHVWALAFSRDGELLATANDDDTVGVWNLRSSGGHVTTLAEHAGRVRSIAFRHDSERLATGCDDSVVRIWDVRGGSIRHTLRGHQDRVYGVAFGHDDSWVASAGWDGDVIVWRGGAEALRMRGSGERLWALAAHPSRPLLAAAGDDRVIRIRDAETGAEVHALSGHTGRVLSLAFSPDGSLLVSGGEDGVARLWTLDGEPALRGTFLGLSEGWAALSPTGRYKSHGTVSDEFWHVIGMTRFEPGDLEDHLPSVRRMAMGEVLPGLDTTRGDA